MAASIVFYRKNGSRSRDRFRQIRVEFARRHNAKRQRRPARKLEERRILGDQELGARRGGELEEFLVVGVAAARQRRGARRDCVPCQTLTLDALRETPAFG